MLNSALVKGQFSDYPGRKDFRNTSNRSQLDFRASFEVLEKNMQSKLDFGVCNVESSSFFFATCQSVEGDFRTFSFAAHTKLTADFLFSFRSLK